MTSNTLAWRAVLWTTAVMALAFANAAALRAHWNLDNIGTSRRYWEDMTVAFSLYETRNWGPTPILSINEAMAIHVNRRLHELVPRAAQRSGLRPWEFWRTVEFRSFVHIAPFELRFSDDTGRSRLSSIGFRWLGGVAPYLPLWLPFLALLPLAFWTMVESLRCGEVWAGAIFLTLGACSAYFLEALTLPYSAAGFHIIAALVIVPLSLFAFGPVAKGRGLWWRVVLVAAVIHVAAWCRSSSIIFLLPASFLLLVALLRSESESSPKRRTVLTVLLLAVLVAPRAFLPKQSHELWVGMWEGLGDFDREHEHEWSDPAARVALDREGHSMAIRGPYWTEETEAIFRRLVLQDLKAYPLWYAEILVRRVVATVTQLRLLPTARDSGMTYRPAQHPAEGYIETYYNFVKTADTFTAFGRSWEAPLWLLWTPSILFLVTAPRRRSLSSLRRLGVVLSFAVSALLMPVAVTTASGIETQVFVFVFFLSAAFLVSDVATRLLRKKTLAR